MEPIDPTRDALVRESARRAVKGPAIAMVVFGALNLVTLLGTAAAVGLQAQILKLVEEQSPNDAKKIEDFYAILTSGWFLGLFAVFLLMSLVQTLGAMRMLSLRSYGLSMAAAILTIVLALLQCGGCCCLVPGAAFGVWAMFVLVRDDVSTTFRSAV